MLDPVLTLTFNFIPVKTVVLEFHVCVKLSIGIELVTVLPAITNEGFNALKTSDGDSFITEPVSKSICPAAPPTVGVLPTVILLIPPPPPPDAVVKTRCPLSYSSLAYKLPPTPTPPATTNAPVYVLVLEFVD